MNYFCMSLNGVCFMISTVRTCGFGKPLCQQCFQQSTGGICLVFYMTSRLFDFCCGGFSSEASLIGKASLGRVLGHPVTAQHAQQGTGGGLKNLRQHKLTCTCYAALQNRRYTSYRGRTDAHHALLPLGVRSVTPAAEQGSPCSLAPPAE